MGKAWNSWGDHGFRMLPMLHLLYHALEKHREAWEYFSGHISRVWISIETIFTIFLSHASIESMEMSP